jgi:hypothetical protein
VDDTGPTPRFVTDAVGNVVGGVRTPSVEVPTSVLSGFSTATASRICQLFGSTVPLSSSELTTVYGTPEAYLEQYTAAADEAIARGFVLAEDRSEILHDASEAAAAWRLDR